MSSLLAFLIARWPGRYSSTQLSNDLAWVALNSATFHGKGEVEAQRTSGDLDSIACEEVLRAHQMISISLVHVLIGSVFG